MKRSKELNKHKIMIKKSFFERLTGSHKEEEETKLDVLSDKSFIKEVEEENEEGQLTVDVFQNPTEIIIQAIIAGVRPEDIDVSITRDMITIKGKREDSRRIERENFFFQELYWGSFSRSILLPQEIDPDEAEAIMKNGILTIKLPKIDKERVQKVKIKGE
ncbi:MAG: Hsp20/alpha crystallin family protein [Candidatus Terrybacteria bacterium]|nr:Hsp20/alpha crystallin family protein [Candidatus Terrybacteria bacterium]